MSLVNETFKIYRNTICNTDYHNRRFNTARSELFSLDEDDIRNHVDMKDLDPAITYKCIITYDSEIRKITYEPYRVKNIRTLKMIHSDTVYYNYKYTDRGQLNRLREAKESCDDILIVKNGNVTDTSFSNIAFSDGKNWFTPSTFLLNGTTRQRLLETGKITEKAITIGDIKNYLKASLINTFYDLDELTLSTERIYS